MYARVHARARARALCTPLNMYQRLRSQFKSDLINILGTCTAFLPLGLDASVVTVVVGTGVVVVAVVDE